MSDCRRRVREVPDYPWWTRCGVRLPTGVVTGKQMAPAGYLGFVYLITAPNGMKYVGKKLFLSARRRKPLKGQKRNRRDHVESDWHKYFGSSNELQAELKRVGLRGWKREILHLCKSKWEMAYVELKEQLARDALLSDVYWNSIIHVRLNQPPRELRERAEFWL